MAHVPGKAQHTEHVTLLTLSMLRSSLVIGDMSSPSLCMEACLAKDLAKLSVFALVFVALAN